MTFYSTNRLLQITLLVMQLLSITLATELNQEDGILPNHSTQFVRTLNRNASTDVDAAFYNPAGLTFLEAPGLHAMFSSQTYVVQKTHTMDYYGINVNSNGNLSTSHSLNSFTGTLPDVYFAEVTVPILPDFDIVYKGESWAVFLDLSVMQAAPGLVYPTGLADLDWGNLSILETVYETSDSKVLLYARDAMAIRTEYYIGTTLGGSIVIKDWLSAALALRCINARGNQTIRIKDAVFVTESTEVSDPRQLELPDWNINTDTRGSGFGVITGLHLKPTEGIDVGFRYEYYLPMSLSKTTNGMLAPEAIEMSGNLDIFKDGTPGKAMEYKAGNGKAELLVTYPQSLSIGVSIKALERLRVEVSSDLSLRSIRDLDGRENYWHTGIRAGGCLEWQFTPSLIISGGYLYNDFGIDPEHRSGPDPLLTSHTLGGGLELGLDHQLSISIGGFYGLYEPEKVYFTKSTNVTKPTEHYLTLQFDEKRLCVSFGLTYHFKKAHKKNYTTWN